MSYLIGFRINYIVNQVNVAANEMYFSHFQAQFYASTTFHENPAMEIATNVGGQRDQAYHVKGRAGRYANTLK